ncbi:MAG: hypothetical protein OXC44_07970 [Proteobacteria bacterium]|nr:hypothetical protein [Pseudomonadota bacterium]
MQHQLFHKLVTWLFMSTLSVVIVACQSGEESNDEFSELEGEDGNMLADTDNNFSESYDQGFENNTLYENSGNDMAENLENNNTYSDMDASGGDESYGESYDATAATPVSGQVYFVTSDIGVMDNMDGTGNTLFYLATGDTVRAEISGDFATIGLGHYVPVSALSETLIERIPATNSWR